MTDLVQSEKVAPTADWRWDAEEREHLEGWTASSSAIKLDLLQFWSWVVRKIWLKVTVVGDRHGRRTNVESGDLMARYVPVYCPIWISLLYSSNFFGNTSKAILYIIVVMTRFSCEVCIQNYSTICKNQGITGERIQVQHPAVVTPCLCTLRTSSGCAIPAIEISHNRITKSVIRATSNHLKPII